MNANATLQPCCVHFHVMVVAMLLQCNVCALRLQCYRYCCHSAADCFLHALAMLLKRHWHDVDRLLQCFCNAIAMQVPCYCVGSVIDDTVVCAHACVRTRALYLGSARSRVCCLCVVAEAYYVRRTFNPQAQGKAPATHQAVKYTQQPTGGTHIN